MYTDGLSERCVACLATQGYLLFYRDMRTMLSAPTRVVAIGTALLQVLVVYSHHEHGVLSAWGRSAFLLGMAVELAIVIVVLGFVVHRAGEHNRRAPLPDVASAFASDLEAEAYSHLCSQLVRHPAPSPATSLHSLRHACAASPGFPCLPCCFQREDHVRVGIVLLCSLLHYYQHSVACAASKLNRRGGTRPNTPVCDL